MHVVPFPGLDDRGHFHAEVLDELAVIQQFLFAADTHAGLRVDRGGFAGELGVADLGLCDFLEDVAGAGALRELLFDAPRHVIRHDVLKRLAQRPLLYAVRVDLLVAGDGERHLDELGIQEGHAPFNTVRHRHPVTPLEVAVVQRPGQIDKLAVEFLVAGVVPLEVVIARVKLVCALDDVRDTPHLDPDPVDAGPIRSLLGLPLIAGDETLGAALITFQTPHPFTPEDIARGKQVAGQVALAMARAELVAELQRYAQDLEARNEELSAFAQTVAHDIKSPLGTLVGSADLLNQAYEALSPEDRHRLTEGILQTGNKITNIVDELLLLAEVRKGDVTQAPLDLDGIVRDARARVAPLIAQTHAEVIVPERWPAALGHGPWVEEVWVNYLSNAIKYGGDPEAGVPPRVELGYDEAEAAGSDVRTCVRFWVRDNGPGLTEAAQAHLFAPFTRLDQARAEGHGLGLSIVRRIVDKLGGDVDVESQVGQGSTFSFTLPAPDEKAS